jgi:hypothetical protein
MGRRIRLLPSRRGDSQSSSLAGMNQPDGADSPARHELEQTPCRPPSGSVWCDEPMPLTETSQTLRRQPSKASPQSQSMTDVRTWLSIQHTDRNRSLLPLTFSAELEGEGFKGKLVASGEWRHTVELIVRRLFWGVVLWLLLTALSSRSTPPEPSPAPAPSSPPCAPKEMPAECPSAPTDAPPACSSEAPCVRGNREWISAHSAPSPRVPSTRPDSKGRLASSRNQVRCYPAAPHHRAHSPPCYQRPPCELKRRGVLAAIMGATPALSGCSSNWMAEKASTSSIACNACSRVVAELAPCSRPRAQHPRRLRAFRRRPVTGAGSLTTIWSSSALLEGAKPGGG